MGNIVKRLIFSLVGKKQIAGFVFGALISAGAFMLGIPAEELQDEACKSPVMDIEKPKAEAPAEPKAE